MDSILFSTELRHLTDKESHIFSDREEAVKKKNNNSQTKTRQMRGKWQADFRLKDSCKLLQASSGILPYSLAPSTSPQKSLPKSRAKLARDSNHGLIQSRQ